MTLVSIFMFQEEFASFWSIFEVIQKTYNQTMCSNRFIAKDQLNKNLKLH